VTPLLITLGEPAGIGADCTLLAFQSDPKAFAGTCVCAPTAWLNDRADILGLPIIIHEVDTPEPSSLALNCWNPGVAETSAVTPGIPSKETASAVITCIETAANACMTGTASGLVTGPIQKSILRDMGFHFPGHTEFLAHLAGDISFVMMLASEQLRVALLTTHMALRDVPDALSTEATLACLRIVHRDMQSRFGIASPRLGLCGLNPHAGEQGHFGREEINILAPAVARACAEGLNVVGPLPADTLFAATHRKAFDAVICCYHDQGLIPLKALSFGDAVNVTLGLPFIRTSVDHGTALDRAGSGDVSYSSFMAALHLAKDMQLGNPHATE